MSTLYWCRNLSDETRKRVDVAPTKSLKVKRKQRKLLLPKMSSSEGEGNSTKVREELEKEEVSKVEEVTRQRSQLLEMMRRMTNSED